MRITQYGTVTISVGPIKVEGFLVEREPSDPEDATTEQLLLDCAIIWARQRFDDALNDATRVALRKKLLARLPKKIYFDEGN